MKTPDSFPPTYPLHNRAEVTGQPYFISTSGNDHWSGRLAKPAIDGTDGPFATLRRARDAVREFRKDNPRNETAMIYLRKGRYRLTEPVIFTAEDFDIRIMPFPGERVELSGSASLTSWQKGTNGRFVTTLAQDPGWEAFVGGVRQALAPKPGAMGGWHVTVPSLTANDFSFREGEIDLNDRTSDMKVELFDNTGAVHVRTRFTRLDFNDHIATVAPADRQPVSNVRSWRLVGDARWVAGKGNFGWAAATHTVTLNPSDPAALARDGMQIPTTHSLIVLRGAHDIAIAGIKFKETGTAPTDELESAAIVLENAFQITVSDNWFENVGQAIRMTGSSRNIVVGNIISDTGGAGIELQDKSDRNTILENTLKRTGRVEQSSAAIYLHGASENRIARNTVTDVPRHAIGIDNWDAVTINISNVVEYNGIRNANQETYDTGAIEMLGRSDIDTNSVIRYNDIRNAGISSSERNAYQNTPASGIYLDDLTSGVLVCGNRISGAPLAAIQVHGGADIVVRDNLVVLDRPESVFMFLQGAHRTSAEEHFNFAWLPQTSAQGQAIVPLPVNQIRLPAARRANPTTGHRLEIRFDNDALINGEDRDLFLGSVRIGTRTLAPDDGTARYVTDDGRSFPGQASLPWNGALIWDLPDLTLNKARETAISVVAWGNSAAGVGAHFTVSIDGVRVGEATANPMPDGMTGNVITRNIVYATAPGKSYFNLHRGGTPSVSTNDYVDVTGTRHLIAFPWTDANPMEIAPELIASPEGDLHLSLSAELRAAGFSDPPICTTNVVNCGKQSNANGAIH
ncbi:MAG: hypothetical protein JWM91_1049 [Rhodospirillales bacterium]|nr:hypothetical protein [Rhodospirillales bacterium]